MNDLKIGELVKRCSVHKETIRYYENINLIPEPDKNTSGYRIYTEGTVERIKFIKRMQDLGFTLKEIAKFLAIVDGDKAKCSDMRIFSSEKLEEVQLKIQDLLRIEKLLKDINQCCNCQNETNIFQCDVISSLLRDE